MEPNIQTTEKNNHPRIICSAKLSFRYKGEIKTFPEAEGIYHQKTSIAGNTQGSYSI